jgi:hypothetical protein
MSDTKDDDKIQGVMDNLIAKGADKIGLHPDTLSSLRKQGLPIKDIPSPTIKQLFDQRLKYALEIASRLPPLPEGLSSTIQSLYQEIRECIFFGLNGAAITLSGILIEFVLKRKTFGKESGGSAEYDQNKWEEFENMELGRTIDRALGVGIVDVEMAKRLHSFRRMIRNPYAHYNIQKITEHVVAENVQILNVETGELEERDLDARGHPFVQTVAKPIVDQSSVFDVFAFADEVVVSTLLCKIAFSEFVKDGKILSHFSYGG